MYLIIYKNQIELYLINFSIFKYFILLKMNDKNLIKILKKKYLINVKEYN